LYICRSIRHPKRTIMKQHVWQICDRCAWAWEKIAKMSSESDKTWPIREHVHAGSFLLSLSALRCILRIFLITLLQSQLRSPEWTPCRQAQACYLKTLVSIETQIRPELIMYRKAVNICYIVFPKKCSYLVPTNFRHPRSYRPLQCLGWCVHIHRTNDIFMHITLRSDT